MSFGSTTITGNVRPKLTKEELAFVKQELTEQLERYNKIVQEQEALTPQREKWVKEFLHRIQTRGYHVHAGMKRVIPKEEIRPRDGRPLQVIF
ncbi:MAG: hypothetical protein JNM81_10515 [Rhodospirillaceae bacterium]|nr:hypothetical protein [Rhodospirillaceae bacterium]